MVFCCSYLKWFKILKKMHGCRDLWSDMAKTLVIRQSALYWLRGPINPAGLDRRKNILTSLSLLVWGSMEKFQSDKKPIYLYRLSWVSLLLVKTWQEQYVSKGPESWVESRINSWDLSHLVSLANLTRTAPLGTSLKSSKPTGSVLHLEIFFIFGHHLH